MAEPPAQPEPPPPCSACRASGSVVSNIGGSPHTVPCPWCEGVGAFLPGHDAQAHWREPQPSPAD
jgi:hypothetical protein